METKTNLSTNELKSNSQKIRKVDSILFIKTLYETKFLYYATIFSSMEAPNKFHTTLYYYTK